MKKTRLFACIFFTLALAGCGQAPEEGATTPAAEITVGSLSGAALQARIEAGDAPLILDVRTPGEYAAGHIPGAVNIPHTEVGERLAELGDDRGREIVVHCKSGRRADTAETLLVSTGYTNVAHLQGDMDAWEAGGRPLVKEATP